ncbi:hypothetical protein [Burkholderia pyrrocinia]|uniref:hypothetical protein n=1 Tax=Burkholderia pyrrocinia TaxID=60550 RepID=UPI00158D8F37|nr:hypothetical protein [Burkholderia pyrrocinia]
MRSCLRARRSSYGVAPCLNAREHVKASGQAVGSERVIVTAGAGPRIASCIFRVTGRQ